MILPMWLGSFLDHFLNMLQHGVKGQVVVEEPLKRLDRFTLGPFDSISLPQLQELIISSLELTKVSQRNYGMVFIPRRQSKKW